MGDKERVRLTSLDEAFDDDMKAALAGTSLPAAAAASEAVDGLLAYVRGNYAVERFEGAPTAPPAGGGLRAKLGAWARKLFVSRTYHASLYSALEEIAERQRALEARVNDVARRQEAFNEVSMRVVFKLWGDYNHLVRTVLDHQLNEITPSLVQGLKDEEARATESFEELTRALRDLETRLAEIEGPHDRVVQ